MSCSTGERSLGQRHSLSLGGGQVGGERVARCPVKWGGVTVTLRLRRGGGNDGGSSGGAGGHSGDGNGADGNDRSDDDGDCNGSVGGDEGSGNDASDFDGDGGSGGNGADGGCGVGIITVMKAIVIKTVMVVVMLVMTTVVMMKKMMMMGFDADGGSNLSRLSVPGTGLFEDKPCSAWSCCAHSEDWMDLSGWQD